MIKSNIQLKNFIIQSTGVHQFNISNNGQFIVLRKIISDVFPDFPDALTFKLYLYLCRAYERKFYKIKKAKTQIQQDLNINRTELDQALNWLENNYFIQRSNTNIHQMYQSKLLTVPDYDPFTKKYISCEDIPFHTGILKIRNHGYIMLPSDALTNDMLRNTTTAQRRWSQLKLKVYLLLYANCWLEYFGGVNPKIIQIDESTNSIHVDPSICYNVKASEKQVVQCIESLLKEQRFVIVRSFFKYGIYLGDDGKLTPSNQYNEHLVLRPIYISENKVNDSLLDSKRSYMIL